MSHFDPPDNVSSTRDGEGLASNGKTNRKQAQTAAFVAIAALSIACVLGLIWVLMAERIPDLTEDRLAAAQKLWEENGPASYDLDIVLRGAQPGKVHVEVRDGQVTAETRDGAVPPEHTWEYWTVPGQFGQLEQEFALAHSPNHEAQGAPGSQVWMRGEFDPKYGYPRVYHRVITDGGPEVYWKTTKFEQK